MTLAQAKLLSSARCLRLLVRRSESRFASLRDAPQLDNGKVPFRAGLRKVGRWRPGSKTSSSSPGSVIIQGRWRCSETKTFTVNMGMGPPGISPLKHFTRLGCLPHGQPQPALDYLEIDPRVCKPSEPSFYLCRCCQSRKQLCMIHMCTRGCPSSPTEGRVLVASSSLGHARHGPLLTGDPSRSDTSAVVSARVPRKSACDAMLDTSHFLGEPPRRYKNRLSL